MFIYCEKHIPKNVPNFLCGLSLFLLHRRSSFSVLYPLYSRPFLCVFSALLFRPFQPRLSNFILQTAQPVLLELSVFLASCVHCMWLICPQCPCVKSLFLCFCHPAGDKSKGSYVSVCCCYVIMLSVVMGSPFHYLFTRSNS